MQEISIFDGEGCRDKDDHEIMHISYPRATYIKQHLSRYVQSTKEIFM